MFFLHKPTGGTNANSPQKEGSGSKFILSKDYAASKKSSNWSNNKPNSPDE